MQDGDKRQGMPNCVTCAHFAVTYKMDFPRSCTLFGIQCRELPSWEVYKSTGKFCTFYEKKKKNPKA